MSLRVEVVGYGLCQTTNPYVVFVIVIQQEKFEAWTVYRRFNSFELLYNQLVNNNSNTNIPTLPQLDITNLTPNNLQSCCILLNNWLQIPSNNNIILRMQSMYQFLCIDANMPPPYLEIHWNNTNNNNQCNNIHQNNEEIEEMDMDEMFDREDMEDDDDEEISGDERPSNTMNEDNEFNNNTIFGFTNNNNQQLPAINNKRKNDDDEDNDEKEIMSLSVAQEAEFIYNKKDDNNSNDNIKRTINLDAFKIIKVVGKGSFGKVFLVRDKSNGQLYAMKVLKKEYIIKKNQVEHTKTERSVLGYISHPYIVGLNMAFQTAEKLFLVLDYCPGGELFFHLGQVGRFSEERSKFYAAQIILALEYIHKMDVIYRDLKPENLLLDQYGNVRLTDFGLSKEGVSDHSTGANSFCGTPEYIAPEVLLRQGHGRAVDWWSLGALLFEMITGLPPFYSRNRETMFQKIMKAEINFPPHVSHNAKDLLSNLLVRDPKMRLGSGERDANEIKEHAFFHDCDWSLLTSGKAPAPFIPTVASSLDTSLFDPEFTSMMPIVSPDVRGAYFGSLDKAFEGFTFVGDSTAAKYAMKHNSHNGTQRRPSHSKNTNKNNNR